MLWLERGCPHRHFSSMAFLRSIQIFMNGLFMENHTDVLRPHPHLFFIFIFFDGK